LWLPLPDHPIDDRDVTAEPKPQDWTQEELRRFARHRMWASDDEEEYQRIMAEVDDRRRRQSIRRPSDG
jgi:hypothetical protein